MRSPAYIGQLARWTRAHADEVEGLYTSPLIPAAADHTVSVIAEIARTYAIDGVHLDYARYPNEAFDYSASALEQFKLVDPARPYAPNERQDAAAREALDPLAYPNLYRRPVGRFPPLPAHGARDARSAPRCARRDPGRCSAPRSCPTRSRRFKSRLQDWRTWLDESLLDVLCPMAYTTDAAVFQQQIAAAKDYAGRPAGVGRHRRLSAEHRRKRSSNVTPWPCASARPA